MAKLCGRSEDPTYRRKDGLWAAQYTVGERKRYMYGKTRKDVVAAGRDTPRGMVIIEDTMW